MRSERRKGVHRPSGDGSSSQRFALVQEGEQKYLIPVPRFANTDFYLEGELFARVLSDLGWLKEDDVIYVAKSTHILPAQITNIITQIYFEARYGRIERHVKLGLGFEFPLPDALMLGEKINIPKSLNTATLFFQSDQKDAKPLSVVPIDMDYIQEADIYTFSSLKPGRLGEIQQYRVLYNIPLITLVEGESRGLPHRKFGQLKRLILLESADD